MWEIFVSENKNEGFLNFFREDREMIWGTLTMNFVFAIVLHRRHVHT